MKNYLIAVLDGSMGTLYVERIQVRKGESLEDKVEEYIQSFGGSPSNCNWQVINRMYINTMIRGLTN